jgi:hypothetical protein
MAKARALVLSTALLFASSLASAAAPDQGDDDGARRGSEPAPRTPSKEHPRIPPDYDGRPSEPSHPSGALWVPRVVLFPLWVVSEYVIRRPLGWVTTEAERANIQTLLLDFFTFGPERNGGIVPTALFDFGLRPSVGVYFFWDDAGFEGHDLRLHAATGGTDWLKAAFADRIALDARTKLEHHFLALSRPDYLYAGHGWDARDGDRSRYSASRFEAQVGLSRQLSAFGWFSGYVGVRRVTFESGSCCDDPGIASRVAAGAYALPSGFDEGYSVLREGLSFELDTRRERPQPGSGFRAMVRGEHGGRLAGESAREYVRYGGALSAFWDLDDHNRVLSLSLGASFADPLGEGSAALPFTEEVQLGGDQPLRGFLEGRLTDRSAIAARLGYDWPIWAFLDGSIQIDAGNVYAEQLEDFALDRNRLSFAIGIRSAGRRDHPFELLIGTATTPIEDGAHLDSFRFVLGATNAF